MNDGIVSLTFINMITGHDCGHGPWRKANRFTTADPFLCLSISLKDDADVPSVEVNKKPIELAPDAREIYIPCVFSVEANICSITINSSWSFQIEYRYSNKYADRNTLLASYEDFCKQVKNNSFADVEEFVNLISQSKIRLISFEYDKIAEGLGEDLISEIEKRTKKDVFAILTRPDLQLVMETRQEPIERANKIDSFSVRHLAAHSEFWRSVGIAGVYPDRIMTGAMIDSVHTYENIFVRMVIDKMYEIVQKQALESSIKKYSEAEIEIIRQSVLSDQEGEKTASDPIAGKWVLYNELFVPLFSNNYDSNDSDREKIYSNANRAVKTAKESPYYRELCHDADLPIPVYLTSVLRHQEHYHNVYKMWQHMTREKSPEFSDKTTESAGKSLLNYYAVYIGSLLVWSLKKMQGYKKLLLEGNVSDHAETISVHADIPADGKANRAAIRATLDSLQYAGLRFFRITYSVPEIISVSLPKKNRDIVEALCRAFPDVFTYQPESHMIDIAKPVGAHQKREINDFLDQNAVKLDWLAKIKQELDSPPNKHYQIDIIPAAAELPSSERDLAAWGTKVLSDLSEWCEKEKTDSVLMVYPYSSLDLDSASYGGFQKNAVVESDKGLQYSLNYGNAFVDKELVKKCGNYKVSVLPISRKEPMAPIRIVRYLQMHIQRLKIEWGFALTVCPVCGNDTVAFRNGDPYCQKCNAKWNYRECPSCHCKHPWIGITQKMGEKIKDNAGMFPEDISPVKEMTNIELLVDNSIITDFRPPKKYRCPICGYIEKEGFVE